MKILQRKTPMKKTMFNVIGGEVERIPAGQLDFCDKEQESGSSPYIEVIEDGVIVAMGNVIFLPFKK